MKAVNEMRKNGEPLNAEDKHRILGFCCDPGVTDYAELTESLSAVNADDTWANLSVARRRRRTRGRI